MHALFPTFANQIVRTRAAACNDSYQTPPRDPLLLSVCRLSTFTGERSLSASTGFFFERQNRFFLVTGRHVFHDDPSQHFPDRISFAIHDDPVDLTRLAVIDLPLYREGTALWTQACDSGGDIDVAALELPADALPAHVRSSAFTPESLCDDPEVILLGTPVVLACFPLGFYDTTYLLPIARQGSIASAYGIRFQGRGCFVTDARMHRGSSGAPVVVRRRDCHDGGGPWMLLGVHSARMDMESRDTGQDDMLGLNLAWYADILATLTAGGNRS
jgi:hypothetical protein